MEEQALYEKGIDAFLKTIQIQSRILASLQKNKKEIQLQKEKTYSPQLLELDRQISNFESNTSEFTSLLKLLVKHSATPDFKTRFPHLHSLNEEIKGSPEDIIRSENKRVLSVVTQNAKNIKGESEFNQIVQDYKTQKIGENAFGHFLIEKAREMNLDAKVYAALEKQVAHYTRIKNLNASAFTKELDQLVLEVKSKLFRNDRERTLNARDRETLLREKLAKLKLSRAEWKEAIELKSKKDMALDLDSAFAFYENAEAREKAMLANLIKEMDRRKLQSSVLVVGGFHAEGLTQELKQKGISYELFIPKIQNIGDEQKYLDLMQGRVSWKSYFKVENGRIDLYEAFAEATIDQLLEKDFSVLKLWRDQIIRSLAEKNEITKANSHTRFLDAAAYKNLSSERKKTIEKEWRNKVEVFISGLEKLKTENRLSVENIGRLTTPTAQAAAATVTDDVPSRWFEKYNTISKDLPAELARAESRNMPDSYIPTAADLRDLYSHTPEPRNRPAQELKQTLGQAITALEFGDRRRFRILVEGEIDELISHGASLLGPEYPQLIETMDAILNPPQRSEPLVQSDEHPFDEQVQAALLADQPHEAVTIFERAVQTAVEYMRSEDKIYYLQDVIASFRHLTFYFVGRKGQQQFLEPVRQTQIALLSYFQDAIEASPEIFQSEQMFFAVSHINRFTAVLRAYELTNEALWLLVLYQQNTGITDNVVLIHNLYVVYQKLGVNAFRAAEEGDKDEDENERNRDNSLSYHLDSSRYFAHELKIRTKTDRQLSENIRIAANLTIKALKDLSEKTDHPDHDKALPAMLDMYEGVKTFHENHPGLDSSFTAPSATILNVIGLQLFRANELAKATEVAMLSRTLDPKNAHALNVLGLAAAHAGNIAAAEDYLKAIEDEDKDFKTGGLKETIKRQAQLLASKLIAPSSAPSRKEVDVAPQAAHKSKPKRAAEETLTAADWARRIMDLQGRADEGEFIIF
jgi:hypothetical protein